MRNWMQTAVFAAIALVVGSCSEHAVTGPALGAADPRFTHESAMPDVRVSEIHYDNTGTDVGERIEISGPAGFDLTGWRLVLYNGNPASLAPYNTRLLNQTIPATCGARGVIVLDYPTNGIQNGGSGSTATSDPDGWALVDASDHVVEFRSYEGVLTAASGPAAGLTSVDIGVRQVGTEPIGSSLHRQPDGVWAVTLPLGTNTFGACNDAASDAAVDSVAVAPEEATVFEGTIQNFTATAFDADGEPVTGAAFTWSSTNESVATVDASGVATAVAEGTTQIVATSGGVSGEATLIVEALPPEPEGPVFFTEIHYDNDGVDVGEAIEIEGPTGKSVNGWSVVLYNGNGGVVYNTRILSGTFPSTCDGRGVIVVEYPTNGIQNGPEDGFALVNAAGNVVEFLSYEGTLTATNGPALGMTSTDIGVSEPASSAVGRSLQRAGTGEWFGPSAHSFGACNPAEPPPPQISITGRTVSADPPLPVGFEDQLFATMRSSSNVEIPTTFTWTSLTPAIASIDERGVMRALAPGTATLQATSAEGIVGTISLPTQIPVASTTASYEGNAEFGEPTDGNPADDFIVRRPQYTASWNPIRGIPNWVAFNMEATHFGPEPRCDCFTFDDALPGSFQRYNTADYTGAGAFHGYGIDRGHLLRSFDRTAASLDNAVTYYFTNIIPQAADNNQGPWAIMENHLGDLARFQNKEVYVIAGASGSKGTVKDEGKITIPARTWKVAIVMERNQRLSDISSYADFELIAVDMPNDPGIRNVDWNSYRTTVNAIEALSGYDLLALLPDHIEAVVESGIHTVKIPVDQLLAAGVINRGRANSLKAKLRAAANQLERGNVTPAVNQLEAFVRELDDLVASGVLTAAQAQPARSAAVQIIQSVSH